MAKRVKDSELSDLVYVAKDGKLRFIWDLFGEIDGVFDWDGQLDFYTILKDGDKY
jgi:hypothetical protein